MKKFRKVLDGLTTSSPVNPGGSPACGSAAGTPSATPTPRELEIQETLMSEHFQICKCSETAVAALLVFQSSPLCLHVSSSLNRKAVLTRPKEKQECAKLLEGYNSF
ncbi:unnamed protein product [Leuciscus chuanchicus]